MITVQFKERKQQDFRKWEDIPVMVELPFPVITVTQAVEQASESACDMVQDDTQEIRYNVLNSCQGHYLNVQRHFA